MQQHTSIAFNRVGQKGHSFFQEFNFSLNKTLSNGVWPFLFVVFKTTPLISANCDAVKISPLIAARCIGVFPSSSFSFMRPSNFGLFLKHPIAIHPPLSTAAWRAFRPLSNNSHISGHAFKSSNITINPLRLVSLTAIWRADNPSLFLTNAAELPFFKTSLTNSLLPKCVAMCRGVHPESSPCSIVDGHFVITSFTKSKKIWENSISQYCYTRE